MFRDTVADLLEECMQKRPDLFLIDFEIIDGNIFLSSIPEHSTRDNPNFTLARLPELSVP